MQKNVLERMRSGKGLLLLFMVMFLVSGTGLFAQSQVQPKVSISFQKQPLGLALRQLQQLSKYSIAFTEADVKAYEVPAQSFTDAPVVRILQALLKNTSLQLKETGEYLVIVPGSKPSDRPVAAKLSGALRGRVVDFETAQPLAGATVQLSGRAQGTVANDKGYYSFNNIAAGTYTLEVSYSGYQRNTFPDITIESGRTAVYDVKMLAGGSLQEVVVDASSRRIKAVSFSTDKQLIGEIRNASAVVSGISNEQITKTADRNAAEVVKRISGVTVTDDRFIVVRGMNQRYNITYVNNNIAPSTELYSRAFAYDLLPTSIIDRILVYKSPTAELFGDYAGGAVKVFTKNAKPVRHLDIGLQLSYREGTTGKQLMRYNGGKLDWLGFDDGKRKLPSNMGSMNDGSGLINLQPLAEKIKGFNPDFKLYQQRALPDMQFYVNFFDNWKIGKWRLYDLTSLTYQLDNRNYELYRQTGGTHRKLIDPYTDHDRIGIEQQATQIARINLLQNFTLRINKLHSVAFQNFLMNEGRDMVSSTLRMNNSPSWATDEQTKVVQYSFQQRALYTGNLNGYHFLSADSTLFANWSLGYTWYLDKRPDQRRMNYHATYLSFGGGNIETEPKEWRWKAAGSNMGTPVSILNGMLSRFFQDSKQQTYTAAVDLGMSLLKQLQLKAGAYNLYRTRTVARRYFKVNRFGVQGKPYFNTDEAAEASDPSRTNQQIVHWRETDLHEIWSSRFFRNDGSGLELYDASTPIDAYVGSEQNNSGYFMTDWHPFNKKLVVNAGVRIEYNRQRVSAAISSGGLIFPVSADLEKTNVLPSVNISFAPVKRLTIRAGYGRTVNRPDFKELSPFADRDYTNLEEISGNPQLVSATIDNYDFRLEWYPRSAAQNELFNVGVFYKRIQNPIERYRNEKNNFDIYGYTSISFNNPDEAKVYGIEAEIRKSLSFIPGNIFKQLSLNVNGAWIKSEVSNKDNVPTSPDQLGTFSGRALQGQAPYVVNAGLYYENAASGTKIGVIYNVSGTSIYAVSVRNKNNMKEEPGLEPAVLSIRPSILELPRHLFDLSASQRLYKSLQVRFTVQNLLDKAYQLAEDNNDNGKYEKEIMITNEAGTRFGERDNIFLRYNTGRFYNLSFTYSF